MRNATAMRIKVGDVLETQIGQVKAVESNTGKPQFLGYAEQLYIVVKNPSGADQTSLKPSEIYKLLRSA